VSPSYDPEGPKPPRRTTSGTVGLIGGAKPGGKASPKPRITVEMENRRSTFRCDVDLQPKLKLLYRYLDPNRNFVSRYLTGMWDGYKHLMAHGRVGTGLLLAKRDELEAKFDVTYINRRTKPKFHPRVAEEAEGRKYQEQAVEAMIAASNTGGILLAATGSGKTRTAAMYFRRLQGTACFVVDELSLLEQTRREFAKALNEPIGVVGRSKFELERITVATIQTLSKHCEGPHLRKWIQHLDVIILDEYHVAINKRNIDVIAYIAPKAVFGLTGSLQLDKPEVFLPAAALAGPVIFKYPIQQGVEEGYLSPGTICCVQFHNPLKGRSPSYWTTVVNKQGDKERVQVPGGSSLADYRHFVTLNAARNRCIADLAREGVRRGRRVVILVNQRAHLYLLSKRLADIPHRALCGDQKAEERLEAMKMMDAGKLPLIIASRIFAKGVDIVSVSMIIDGTALPGRNSALQRYGRGARLAEGKDEIWYVDISDIGSPMTGATFARRRAFKELGSPIVVTNWSDGVDAVFRALST
jgi:superfamily II DNA or RNA helicase